MTMKRTVLAAALVAPLVITSLAGLASAQESEALVTYKSLRVRLETIIELNHEVVIVTKIGGIRRWRLQKPLNSAVSPRWYRSSLSESVL